MSVATKGSSLPVVVFLAANVLFGSGLFFHSFLYNFYLNNLSLPPTVMGHAAAALGAGGTALSLLLFLLLRVPSVGVADVPPAAAVKIGTPEASLAPARHSGVLWFV